MVPLQNLVYYGAVAKGTVILADYADEDAADLPSVAAKCLENVPPLHNRFSYTTSKRMFICLIEGIFIYCAIMDEALSKAKAFLFLEQLRDAFNAFLKERGTDAEILGPHFLHEKLAPIIRNLRAPLVGTPQKEKDRIEWERRDAEVDFEVSCPSAVVSLDDLSGLDEQQALGSQSPHMALIEKGKKDENNVQDQEEEEMVIMLNKGKAMDKGKKIKILVEGSTPTVQNSQMQRSWGMEVKGQQHAQKMWWRNVKLVVLLDILVCLILLSVWLGVCQGVKCLKRK